MAIDIMHMNSFGSQVEILLTVLIINERGA